EAAPPEFAVRGYATGLRAGTRGFHPTALKPLVLVIFNCSYAIIPKVFALSLLEVGGVCTRCSISKNADGCNKGFFERNLPAGMHTMYPKAVDNFCCQK